MSQYLLLKSDGDSDDPKLGLTSDQSYEGGVLGGDNYSASETTLSPFSDFFTSFDTSTWTVHGDASYISSEERVQLTPNSGNQDGALEYDSGISDTFWETTFKFEVASEENSADDVWLKFYTSNPTTYTASDGYSVAYDHWNDEIQIHNEYTGDVYSTDYTFDTPNVYNGRVRFRDGTIEVYLDGDLKIEHTVSSPNYQYSGFAYAGRTGGSSADQYINSLEIATELDSPEFVAWESSNAVPDQYLETGNLYHPYKEANRGIISYDPNKSYTPEGGSVRHEATDNDSYTNSSLYNSGDSWLIKDANPGERYRSTAWVKSESGSVDVQIYCLGGSSSTTPDTFTYSSKTVSDTAWSKISTEHTLGSDENWVTMRLDNDGGDGAVVYWDNIRLEKVVRDSSSSSPIGNTQAASLADQLGDGTTSSSPAANVGIASSSDVHDALERAPRCVLGVHVRQLVVGHDRWRPHGTVHTRRPACRPRHVERDRGVHRVFRCHRPHWPRRRSQHRHRRHDRSHDPNHSVARKRDCGAAGGR